MPLVLDTGILIELYKGDKRIRERVEGLIRLYPENPAITFANFSEFYIGMLGKGRVDRERALSFLDKFTLLNTTKESSKKFSELKYRLERGGKAIPVLDVLIASIVMEKNLVLLTADRHFERIEGLSVIVL